MNKTLIVLIAASLLPAYANAAKLNLKQDLAGLDLVVAMEPKDSPTVIKVTNKSQVVALCALGYTGADSGMANKVTIQPGKSATVRVTANASDAPRSANLKCIEKKVASK